MEEQAPRLLLDIEIEQAEIPLDKINKAGRSRQEIGNIAELAMSIKQKGLINPVAVMRYEKPYEGFDYFLLAGARRLMAFEQLKMLNIPARVYPPDLNGYEIRAVELEENLRRKDLTDGERLKMVKQVHDLYESLYGKKTSTSKEASGHSVRDTAEKLNLAPSTVSDSLKLAAYIEQIPELEKKSQKEIRQAVKQAKKSVARKERLEQWEEEDKGTGEELKLLEKSYILGDFFEKVKSVPDGSIDLVDIDIDYPMDVEDNVTHQRIEEDKKRGVYHTVTKDNYPGLMKKSLEESFRMLREGGWIIIWFGREYFQQIQDWASEIGFKTTYYTGRWIKGMGAAHTRNPTITLGHSVEEFFYFRKGNAELEKPHGDCFFHPPIRGDAKKHPYEKPVELMQEILSIFVCSGSRIVIPFAGSGNTLKGAWMQKCRAMGFDLSKEYRDDFIIDIRERFGTPLFDNQM